MHIILLENIRSAYNVGNVIRTADALGRQVRLSWYTPSPKDTPKVVKTSLWAEENVSLRRFDSTKIALTEAKKIGLQCFAAEITENSISLNTYIDKQENILVIFWNEIEWVMQETLKSVEKIVHIPMQGIKESLNIGQSAAIVMWELGKIV